MNRRWFLKAAAIASAAPALPLSAFSPYAGLGEQAGLTVEKLIKAKAMLMRNALRPEWGVGPAHYAWGDIAKFNGKLYKYIATS